MSELRKFIQEEAKKARIEALKSCTYEQICDLLDNQEKQINELQRQLAEAREFEKRIKYHCQAYENTGNAWFNMNRIYKEVEQLKEQDQ